MVAFDATAASDGCDAPGAARIFIVDSAASRVDVRVGKAGLLSAAGHEHVVSSNAIEGCVRSSEVAAASVAYLSLPLETLRVDAAEDRRRYGLDADVSQDAIAGTRRNMLERVLHASRYPQATVVARFVDDAADELVVTIDLHGTRSNHRVPVTLQVAATELRVSGTLRASHTRLGLKRFRAAGGLLQVAEELQIEFEIVAERPAAGAGD